MMTVEAFQRTLSAAAPPEDADLALQGLWWAAAGDWQRAHGCVQQREGDPDCDLVHAHLHRQEGDRTNAGYWYRRAGRTLPDISLQEEWQTIAAALLARG